MLSESIEKFVTLAPLMMPNVIGEETPEVESYEDSAVLEYNLLGEHEIGDILSRLKKDMDLSILYHVIRERAVECRQHACALSDPDEDYMYKVNIVTNRNDLVDHLTVTVYTSIDDMIVETRNDMTLHERGGFAEVERMNPGDLANLLGVRDV